MHLQQLASRFRGATATLQDHMLVTSMSVGFVGLFRYSGSSTVQAVSEPQPLILPAAPPNRRHLGSRAAPAPRPYPPVTLRENKRSVKLPARLLD